MELGNSCNIIMSFRQDFRISLEGKLFCLICVCVCVMLKAVFRIGCIEMVTLQMDFTF